MPRGQGAWWVVPEGLVGDIVNALAHPGLTRVHWHVVQDSQKPNNQAEGPYPNQLVAQQAANQLNANPSSTPIAGPVGAVENATGITAIGDFFHRLTESQTWVRVGEVALGGILVYAGIRAIASGSTVVRGARNASGTVTKPVKKATSTVVKVAVPEARLAGRATAKRVAPKTTARVTAHRRRVAKYGAKKPYQAPAPRKPHVRESHIYYHKGAKP